MAPTPPNVTKLPSAKLLASLISQQNTSKSKIDDERGEIGGVISAAVEKHNLHAAAFKLVGKLRRMDAVKLTAFLSHFDDYRTKLGLDSLMASDIPGLDGGEEKPDDGDATIQ